MGLTQYPATNGDVIGPNSSTTGHLAVFADTSGKLLSDGGANTVGTVTSVGVSANGLVVGSSPITTSGTITLALGTPAALSSDDTYSGYVITGLANLGGVTQWNAVYLNASSQWVQADANGSETYPARGIAVATALTTVAVSVMTYGVFRDDAQTWSVPGGLLYMSETAGELTQTPPSTSGSVVQVMGYALSAHVAMITPDLTFLTLV